MPEPKTVKYKMLKMGGSRLPDDKELSTSGVTESLKAGNGVELVRDPDGDGVLVVRPNTTVLVPWAQVAWVKK